MNTICRSVFSPSRKFCPATKPSKPSEVHRDTYGRKGEEIVARNMKAVDETWATATRKLDQKRGLNRRPLPHPRPPYSTGFLGTNDENRGTNFP